MKKVIRFLASLKLAVITILLLAVVIAVGTFVEAEYDASTAARLVYKTPWMFLVMGLLSVNLTAVMVDRIPWRRRHVPFILAHIGILVLLLGSLITMQWGVDGTMGFGIGEKNRFVQLSETELTLWTSFDGDSYTKLFGREVDFFKNPPSKDPLSIKVLGGELKIVDFLPYALPSHVIEPSADEKYAPGLRFQVQNSRVNANEWLVQRRKHDVVTHNFGPALIHLGPVPASRVPGHNEIYITPTNAGLAYTVFYKDPARAPLRGKTQEGQAIKTGWMDLEFRVLRFLPHANERWDYKPLPRPTPMTTSALQVEFLGKKYWVGLDDTVKLFSDRAVYIMSYAHQKLDLGYDLHLTEFQMGRYPGTSRAASYQSRVKTPEGQIETISMNEPLKYKGLTFYQASFQDGPDGKPVASILSVNRDPGRGLKYLGSLIISLGIVWLFYDKRKAASAAARKLNANVS